MLPEGVIEALPNEALLLNQLEQIAINTFSQWGYQLVRPPIMEYAHSFIGDDNNAELATQTIQFKDQLSGQQMGFRADFTPQVARIDAHYLKTDKVARYAYAGELVRSYPTGYNRIRNPHVVGIELLGSSSMEADLEVISLLIAYLNAIQVPNFVISLGNVDIIIELLHALAIKPPQFAAFFEAFAHKDAQRLGTLAKNNALNHEQTQLLLTLLECYGQRHCLDSLLPTLTNFPNVAREVKRLNEMVTQLEAQQPQVIFHVDVADVARYGYHNGFIFSAYAPGTWKALARGGRYDSFGAQFFEKQSQVRPSTGFSCHLNTLLSVVASTAVTEDIILCTLADTPALRTLINDLRQNGHTVIQVFSDNRYPNRTFNKQIVLENNQYQVVTLDTASSPDI